MECTSPRQGLRPRERAGLRGSLAARQRRVSLCETLDRVLNKGAVIAGDVVISVADVPLLYLGLNLMVTSVETLRNWDRDAPRAGDDESLHAAAGECAAAPAGPPAPAGVAP
jgi:gas vesicle structural protein